MAGRTAKMSRKTRETEISIEVNLDGEGIFDVDCDYQFLKHMIETFSRYSGVDIKMKICGDNEHHLIEDAGITLGKAIAKAIGTGPIERMATKTVVMDDALVMTSLDIIDRPYAEIDCPDPLYHHFLRSFAMAAGMTLHMMVIRGFDDHHIIEAGFKSLGLAVGQAIVPRKGVLSTKDRVKVK